MSTADPSAEPTRPEPGVAEPPSLLDQIISQGRIARDDGQRRDVRTALGDVINRITDSLAADGEQVAPDVRAKVGECIAAIDAEISKQLNRILHHPEFQRLEASWRGLHSLVHQAGEQSPDLKLRVLNASKADLIRDMPPGRPFDQSGLWKKVYEEGYGTAGGAPYAALIGDYEFSRSPQDIELLKKVAGIAAAAHAPFIAAASPSLFDWETFIDESNTTDLSKIFRSTDYIAWRGFRESDDSRYVGLCLPHVLMRLPYGKEYTPAEEFDFEEDVDGRDHSKYLWGNAAYAFATRLTDSFARYNWCAAIRGLQNGGKVENLKIHNFKTDEGDAAGKCPTEVAITDRREKEFSDQGFIPLVHYKDTDYAVFFAAQSCHKPPKYSTAEADANARLGTQLQYMMSASRIAHYLKVIARDKIGSFTSLEDCQRELNVWIRQYVTEDETASDEAKARSPLRAARIDVEEVPGRNGCYTAVAYLRPHYMLDELTVSLRLVAQLPESKNA